MRTTVEAIVKDFENWAPPGVPQQRMANKGHTAALLGAYRGQQTGWHETIQLLKKWGFSRIAKRLQKHFGLDDEGSIVLGE